jgi:hypothetical protein
MARSKSEDLAYGLAKEEQMITQLQEKFGAELERSTKPYSPYDFRAEGVRVELKSRTNASEKYPTTMVGLSKVQFAQNYRGEYLLLCV